MTLKWPMRLSTDVRFLVVGTGAFILQVFLTYFLLRTELLAAISSGIAFSLTFFIAFYFHSTWVFKCHGAFGLNFYKYLIAQFLCLMINMLLSSFLIGFGVDNGLCSLIATFFPALTGWVLSRSWVFIK